MDIELNRKQINQMNYAKKMAIENAQENDYVLSKVVITMKKRQKLANRLAKKRKAG